MQTLPPQPGTTAAAETTLHDLGIGFQRQKDGTLLVTGNLDLSAQNLKELPDLSCVTVTGDFLCRYNYLTSLKGVPQAVGGKFFCNGNKLTSLEHAPQQVGGDFFCSQNELKNLEHAPLKFRRLDTDFGAFLTLSSIPDDIRYSPETRARMERERERQFTDGATVLEQGLKVRRPIRLKKLGA